MKALACCLIVVTGYVFGVDGEVNFSLSGAAFGIASSLCVSLFSIYVKKILPILGNNQWKLMIYNNMNTAILMPILIFTHGEVAPVLNYPALYSSFFWSLILLTGLFGFLINIATFLQIRYTSPLSHNVSGTAKACVQTFLGVYIWGNEMSSEAALGTLLSVFGCGLYSYVRYSEMEESKAAAKPKEVELAETGKVEKEIAPLTEIKIKSDV